MICHCVFQLKELIQGRFFKKLKDVSVYYSDHVD